jgi:hypothetical protein
LFGAVTKEYPVDAAILAATSSANPGGALSPVPTAVPPTASSYRSAQERSRPDSAAVSCRAYPDHSCPTVSGTASSRCVRPIFTTSRHAAAFSPTASRSAVTAGISDSATACTAATCIAVGNVSFDDCPMLTWSFGCTGDLDPMTPPTSWMHRFAITSLTFMFDWVPDPVCHTRNGKWASSSPSITSSQTRAMSAAIQEGSRPAEPLASAAAFFTCPNA